MSADSTKSLLSASALLAAAMIVAGGANYALNFALARMLDLQEFGDASLMLAWMLALTSVAVGFQLVTVRAAAGLTDPQLLESLRRRLLSRAVLFGSGLCVMLMVASTSLSGWFHTSSAAPFAIFALGVPGFLGLAVERGLRQARSEFSLLAVSYVIEAVVRVGSGLGLVALGFGASGATWGLTLSFFASWAVVWKRGARQVRTDTVGQLPVQYGVGSIGLLLIGQAVINNGDVLLAKSMFAPHEAGLYLAVAIVGRAVFFGSLAITQVVFPSAVRQDGSKDARVLRSALVLVGLMAVLAAGSLFVGGSIVSELLFGSRYGDAAPLLGPYAMAAGFFAMANLVATVDIARHRLTSSWILLAAGLTQSIALALFAKTPSSMVWIQVAAMAGCLAAIGASKLRVATREIDQTLTRPDQSLEAHFVPSP